MALHSSFNDKSIEQACGLAIAPLKTKVLGPAPVLPAQEQDKNDIVDEAIYFFRPNLLFKNFEIKGREVIARTLSKLGAGDIFQIYMTVFITQCLRRVANEENEAQALKALVDLARMPVPKSNEAGFFMRGIAKEAQSQPEADKYSNYLKQAKEELVLRLIKILYQDGKKSWDHKFWVGLSKKNFMNLKF